MDWNLFAAFVAVLISLAISAVLLYFAGVFKKDTHPQPPSPQPPSPSLDLDALQTIGYIDGSTMIVRYAMTNLDVASSNVHVLISSSMGSTTQTIAKGDIIRGYTKMPITGSPPSSIDYTVTLSGGRKLSTTGTAVVDD